jgi:hypothetical protein
MNMKLNKIAIENFKGIKQFEADFDGENATIKAANGVGKTSVYDAFLWLVFGKDSAGKKDFDLRPLDDDNQVIPGLTVSVTAEIEIDGVAHILRKQQEENVIKGQLRGYETSCWLDEVPKKVNEYQAFINDLIPEETFKMLTNLRQFNELHWEKRRAALLAIAGDIGTPAGFESLLAQLKGRSTKDYKKVLTDRKAMIIKERDEIPARMDELQRGLDQYAGSDLSAVATKRDALKQEIAGLEEQRQAVLQSEMARQEKIDALNVLKNQQAARERQLASDTGGIQHLLDEKHTLESQVSDKHSAVVHAKNAVCVHTGQISLAETNWKRGLEALNNIRESYRIAKERYDKAVSEPCDTKCYACGQELPTDQAEQIKAKKQASLASLSLDLSRLVQSGNAQMEACKIMQAEIDRLKAGLIPLNEAIEKAEIELKEAQEYKARRLAEIDQLIKHYKTTPPDQDAIWLDLGQKINALAAEIGGSSSDKVRLLGIEIRLKQDELQYLNHTLAQADRIKQDAARIEELGETEKQLSQQIADIDAQLAMIDAYVSAESNLIEESVNRKFRLVKFKLFNRLLNGGIEPCCEATLNGVPYQDCSYGQKAIMGIDIINTLSDHYRISVPLFVDNSESITYPLEFSGQLIRLVAQKSVKKLTVEKKETANV